MNLAICSPQLGISPESNSGGEVYDREVLSGFAKKEIKIKLFLPKNQDFPKVINFNIDFALIKSMFPSYIFNFFVFHYLINTYKKEKFDILRVHSPYFVGPAAVLFKKFHPDVSLVASYLHLEENNIIYNLIDKLIIHRFDRIIAISQFTKKEIIKRYKVKNSKIAVAYPGVAQKFQPCRKNQSLVLKYNLGEKKVVLFLGGLKKRKNPLFLIELFKNIKSSDLVLVVAGEGGLKKEMIRLSESFGLTNQIIFTGFVTEGQKVNYYNLADIVLLPSLKEGFGMIAAEAGACGKPVIASNNSSLPEVIKNGKTGFLAETNNLNGWISKINILLKNNNLCRTMGNQAHKYVRQKFSWEKNTKIHLDVFRDLL